LTTEMDLVALEIIFMAKDKILMLLAIICACRLYLKQAAVGTSLKIIDM